MSGGDASLLPLAELSAAAEADLLLWNTTEERAASVRRMLDYMAEHIILRLERDQMGNVRDDRWRISILAYEIRNDAGETTCGSTRFEDTEEKPPLLVDGRICTFCRRPIHWTREGDHVRRQR